MHWWVAAERIRPRTADRYQDVQSLCPSVLQQGKALLSAPVLLAVKAGFGMVKTNWFSLESCYCCRWRKERIKLVWGGKSMGK